MSERESMVERVAKAIYSRDPGYDDSAWAELPADSFARLVCLDQARLAIFVLRDPTEPMLSSGDSAIPRAEADAMPLETGPELLQRLGMDAAKWCAEMAARGVVQADPSPGEIFHAWMCNAIMTAYDIGFAAGERRTETERTLPLLKQALWLARPWMYSVGGVESSPTDWEKWGAAVDVICNAIDRLSPKPETKP